MKESTYISTSYISNAEGSDAAGGTSWMSSVGGAIGGILKGLNINSGNRLNAKYQYGYMLNQADDANDQATQKRNTTIAIVFLIVLVIIIAVILYFIFRKK